MADDTASEKSRKAIKKFRRERLIGRWFANPTVALLRRLGIRTTMATELETIGRKTGSVRSVPVSAAFDDTGAWLISQHGRRSGWAYNIAAEPNIRIRQGRQWRTGTARFLPDDDPAERAKSFASKPAFAGIVAAGFRSLQTDPITVRIDFTDA